MHDYSIDRHPKQKILFALSAVAIFLAPVISEWMTRTFEFFATATGYKRGAVVAVPILSVFYAIFWAFDNKLWRFRFVRRFLLVPDLNGTWECEGRSILRRGVSVSTDWRAEIRIVQSWTRISIRLKAQQSGSESTSCSIKRAGDGSYRMIYSYTNDPRPGERDLSKHDGIAELEFDPDCKHGEGRYFTDQHRQTVGTMNLKRVV